MTIDQNELREFVNREVLYCVSGLISHLAKDDSSEYYDDILNVCSTDDWVNAAVDDGYTVKEDDESGEFYWVSTTDPEDRSDETFDDELEAFQDCCDVNGIESQILEAYEHWIVTDYLARKLERQGEMVSHDIHGLTVWGRPTTGQAIYLDGVIERIYKQTHSKD